MKPSRLILCLGVAAVFVTPAMANKQLVQKRQERIQFAEEQWQRPEKVTLNIQYRVPVIEVLGYLAANYSDTQKLNTIATDLRPIAARVNELSGDTFEGRSFPAELEAETSKMRSQMMSDVTKVYGSAVTQKVEAYIEQKYHYLKGGIFGPLD